MKKRPIIWVVFIVLALIITFFGSKCAKAEGWITPADTAPPTLEPLPSFGVPTPSPVPEVTPAPSSGPSYIVNPFDERDEDEALQTTYLYTRQFRTQYNQNTILTEGYTYYLFNDGGTATIQGNNLRNYARPVWGGHIQYDDNTGEEKSDFTGTNYLSDTAITPQSVNVKFGSFVWAFADCPQVDLEGAFNISYSFGWNNARCLFNPSQTYIDAFTYAGVNYDALLKTPLYIVISVYDTNNDVIGANYYEIKYSNERFLSSGGNYSFADVFSGEPLGFRLEFDLPDGVSLGEVAIMFVATPQWDNPLYDMLERAFQYFNITPSNLLDYGTWSFMESALVFSRSVARPPEPFNLLKLLSKLWDLFVNLFIPTQEQLQEAILGGVPMLDGTSASRDDSTAFVLNLRNVIYSFVSSEPPDAILHLPTIKIPINGTGYVLMEAQDINISALERSETAFADILGYVRLATSFTLALGFVNSLVSMVCAVFGLKIWKGVE